MNILVQNSDTSTLGGGGIPPMIYTYTKTTTIGSVPDYTVMMAQNAQLIAALANLQSSPAINATAGTAWTQVVLNYWKQQVYYCNRCGVTLKHHSINCKWKGKNHKDDVTFADKKGGLAKRDHVWQLWCKPITNKVHKVLPLGSKTIA